MCSLAEISISFLSRLSDHMIPATAVLCAGKSNDAEQRRTVDSVSLLAMPTSYSFDALNICSIDPDDTGTIVARRLFAKDVLAAKAQRKDKQRLKAILCVPASWHQGWWLHKQMLKATRSLSTMTSAQNVCLLHPQF